MIKKFTHNLSNTPHSLEEIERWKQVAQVQMAIWNCRRINTALNANPNEFLRSWLKNAETRLFNLYKEAYNQELIELYEKEITNDDFESWTQHYIFDNLYK